MNFLLNKAGAVALVSTLMITLLGTSGSSAAAQQSLTAPFSSDSGAVAPIATPLGSDFQAVSTADDTVQPAPAPVANMPPAIPAASLEQLMVTNADAAEATGQLKCLAGAIYFEARSESLEGQLAVGRVIIARARSGRFPASYCGVVYQPSQFSFVRGQTMPSVDAQSRLWQRAVAVARIADAGSWQSPAEGALFFHAARLSTNWRMKRIAQIDHHIFYR